MGKVLRVKIKGDAKDHFWHGVNKLLLKDGWLKFKADGELVEINNEYIIEFDMR